MFRQSKVCEKWLREEEISIKDMQDYCYARNYLYVERFVDAEAYADWEEVDKCFCKFQKALNYINN